MQNARELLAQERKRAAGVQQGTLPQHVSRLERASAAVKAAEQEDSALSVQDQRAKDARDFHNKMAIKKAAETTEQRKARLSQAQSDGQLAGDKYRDEHGGWGGLAAHLHKYVQQASNYGADKVRTSDIQKHYPDITVRAIDTWLERPEFRRTAQLLGRR